MLPDSSNGGRDVACSDCGAHFKTLQDGNSGGMVGGACPECGGTRMFDHQPNPVESDGTLRNLVDMDTGADAGGMPLMEGTITSRVASSCPGCGAVNSINSVSCPSCGTMMNNIPTATNWGKGIGGDPSTEGTIVGQDGEQSATADTHQQDNFMHAKVAHEPVRNLGDAKFPSPHGVNDISLNVTPYGEAHAYDPNLMTSDPRHNVPIGGDDPLGTIMMQGIPGVPGQRSEIPGMYKKLEENSADWGNVLPIRQGAQASKDRTSVSEKVERMTTLNLEPYAPLWDESYVREAGILAPIAEGIGGAVEGAGGLSGLLQKALPFGIGHLMTGIFGGGQQAGGMAPQRPAPPPQMEAIGHTRASIPMLLVADLNIPGPVKSVDEQEDDPEKQDQKEFNDGDMSPSNQHNPNLQDSGADGEDAARENHEGYGYGPNTPGMNSPAIDRAMMILPLLLHYLENGGGDSDPLVTGLHDMLEQENPDYLKNLHPEGQKYLELIIQNHKSPHKVEAGINAFPSGLPSLPGTGLEVQDLSHNQFGVGTDTGAGNGGGAGAMAAQACPSCGQPMVNGACPQHGLMQAQHPGMPTPTTQPMQPFTGKMANEQGPITPEQQQTLMKAMEEKGMSNMIPDMLQNPQNWGWLLNEIQQQPNTPPLVDPSQAQPSPAPMPGMPNAPGAMPVADPTQPQGGMGMPMQPMAKVATQLCPQCGHDMGSVTASGTIDPNVCSNCGYRTAWNRQADANNLVPRCPKCGTATTSIMAGADNDVSSPKARCHGCGHTWHLNDKKSHIVLADLPNPVLREDASELHQQHPDAGQDPSMVWQDAHGKPLEVGQTYELYTAGIDIPDEIQVVAKKPDALECKLVGNVSSIYHSEGAPTFEIHANQMAQGKYTFQPSQSLAQDQPEPPLGGMPGMEQIPESGPTTDEMVNSYPNEGTTSHVAGDVLTEDLCHKCGCDWITHTASSPSTTMHECASCLTAWETKDEFEGRQSNYDLSWIRESSNFGDDFYSDMERAREMHQASAGSPSRSLASALAKDDRYQRIHETLKHNAQTRTAGRHFTPSEQQELIREKGTARNADLLDLSGTHYVTRYDPTGKANEDNVDPGHLIFGL